MAKILISGGSGLVGKALCKQLIALNHEVRILSRSPKSISNLFFGTLKLNKLMKQLLKK
jgi:uncharacterized protein YbjT (DUF2867 family)